MNIYSGSLTAAVTFTSSNLLAKHEQLYIQDTSTLKFNLFDSNLESSSSTSTLETEITSSAHII